MILILDVFNLARTDLRIEEEGNKFKGKVTDLIMSTTAFQAKC